MVDHILLFLDASFRDAKEAMNNVGRCDNYEISTCIGGGRWNVEWSCSTANWRDSNVEEMLVDDDEQ